jgi:hypothetical protein
MSWKLLRFTPHGLALLLLCVLVPTSVSHATSPNGPIDHYRLLQVTVATEEDEQLAPAINNSGEIVYLDVHVTGFKNDVVSTQRGLLVTGSQNLGFPDVNDDGEVVYAEPIGEPGPNPWSVISLIRGIVGPGNVPRINDRGDIVAEDAPNDDDPEPYVLYRADGTSERIALNDGATRARRPIGLSNKEFLYLAMDDALRLQVYSTKRGLVLDASQTASLGALGANERGDLVYVNNGALNVNGQVVWVLQNDSTAGVDINNSGDIVFGDQVRFGEAIRSQVMLLTKRPNYFISRYGFSYADQR